MKKEVRKCQWSETLVKHLVDIVVEKDKYRQKLRMTNTKNAKNGQYMDCVVRELKEKSVDRGEEFPFDMNQTRQNVRHCVVAFESAVQQFQNKTFSRIQRFRRMV